MANPNIQKLLQLNEELDKKNNDYDKWSQNLDEKAAQLQNIENKIKKYKSLTPSYETEKVLIEKYSEILAKLQNIIIAISGLPADTASNENIRSVHELEEIVNAFEQEINRQTIAINKLQDLKTQIQQETQNPLYKDYFKSNETK